MPGDLHQSPSDISSSAFMSEVASASAPSRIYAVRGAEAEGALRAWLEADRSATRIAIVGFEAPSRALSRAAAGGRDATLAIARWMEDADAALEFAARSPDRIVLVETADPGSLAVDPALGEYKLAWRLEALRERAWDFAAPGSHVARSDAVSDASGPARVAAALAGTAAPTLIDLERAIDIAAVTGDPAWRVIAGVVRAARIEAARMSAVHAAPPADSAGARSERSLADLDGTHATEVERLAAEVDVLRSALVVLTEEVAATPPPKSARRAASPARARAGADPSAREKVPTAVGSVLQRLAVTKRAPSFWLIANSPLFDEAWYRARNPDVPDSRRGAILHYLRHGGFEGRAAGPQFCSEQYLNAYSDVREAQVNPLVHYLRRGRAEGRAAFPVSDTNEPRR